MAEEGFTQLDRYDGMCMFEKAPPLGGGSADTITFEKDATYKMVGAGPPFEGEPEVRRGWVTVWFDLEKVDHGPWQRAMRWLGL